MQLPGTVDAFRRILKHMNNPVVRLDCNLDRRLPFKMDSYDEASRVGCSGCFVLGSIRRLAQFAFCAEPILKLRTGFAAACRVAEVERVAPGPVTGRHFAKKDRVARTVGEVCGKT